MHIVVAVGCAAVQKARGMLLKRGPVSLNLAQPAGHLHLLTKLASNTSQYTCQKPKSAQAPPPSHPHTVAWICVSR